MMELAFSKPAQMDSSRYGDSLNLNRSIGIGTQLQNHRCLMNIRKTGQNALNCIIESAGKPGNDLVTTIGISKGFDLY